MSIGKLDISLCMIVRNGGATLKRCLESVQRFVQEIIIVDTGSDDDSIAIAESYKATVVHHPWKDHFAEARNVSLQHATRGWILSLDADEMLEQESVSELSAIIAASSTDVAFCQIVSERDAADAQAEIVNSLPRLFRNHLGIEYSGRIHEQILPSAEHAGARMTQSAIRILHSGYARDDAAHKKKLERNLKLLRIEANEQPKNGFVQFHLGETYSLLSRLPEAGKAYEKAISDPDLPHYLKSRTYQNYGNVLYKLGRYKDAISAVNKAIESDSSLLMTYVIAALIYQKLNKPQAAIDSLEHLITLAKKENQRTLQFDVKPDMRYVYTILAHNYQLLQADDRAWHNYQNAVLAGSPYFDTFTGMGNIAFRKGNFESALQSYQHAYRLGDRNDSIYIGLMQCYFELGNVAKAIEMLEPLVARQRPIPVNQRYSPVVELARQRKEEVVVQ